MKADRYLATVFFVIVALLVTLGIIRVVYVMPLGGCYKGDPGYGNVDYPPEERVGDAGRDAR